MNMPTNVAAMATQAQPLDHDATVAEFTRLLFDGTFNQVHEDIRVLLLDPVFDPREGLSLPEAGRVAYQRTRHVHGRLEPPLEILRNPLRLFALAEWPALLDVSVFSLLMVHYNLCLGTVVDHATGRPDLADYIAELDDLSSFGVYMATELGYGNNVAALRTEAVYDPATGDLLLNTPDALSRKYMSYSGFRDVPKIAVVMARLKSAGSDRGVYPVIVRITDRDGLCAGIYTAPCPEKPVQGLDNGLTWFDQVRVPRRNLLLGGAGEFLPNGSFRPASGNRRKQFLRAMSRIQPGRLCVSSSAVGAGRASLYIALRYAMQRLTNAPGSTDMPIIEYRSHQLALFTALAKVYAMTFLLNHAKREYLARRCDVTTELSSLIAITKVLSTWEATEVIATCRERCGAQGMFSVNRIADYGSLLQGLVTAEGDNQVLLATAAGQLVAQCGEPASAVPGPDGRSITDPAFHLEMLRYREHVLREAVREAMADDSGGRTYFQAWNGCMNAALDMARTRGVWIALESFLSAIADAGTETARAPLRLLASLYGLTEIRREVGWFLARGVLTAEQAAGIPAAADSLCAMIRPHVTTLTDGFQLSPRLLRAPIAAEDYVAAFQDAVEATGA